ncbi:unnamed protein product [Gordionus sp. m RMFG-2023]|uniref:high mobility group protein DSP1-like n=1 Tax=Gordionus sp. m RMFG-2023 TaxID=3053472 RepID=UPI0030E44FC2
MGRTDKPKGKITAYAFFVQTCREEHKSKYPTDNVVFAEFSKKCAQRWKTMTPQEKSRFQEMAEKDTERYKSEMANYDGPEKNKTKKRKRVKDPDAPKRALSAFFIFCNDERPKIKLTDPGLTVGDIAKELGLRWSRVLPEAKQKYEKMAEKEKERYMREITLYRSGKKVKADEDNDEE